MTSEEIKISINVRQLISAYESRTNTSSEAPLFRPRARSLGNLLAKDVNVKLNKFNTLEDIDEVLEKIEQDLENYETYNKAKHVAFQEELFNILTSIINIDNDNPNKANYLIMKTKSMVTVLNHKLPSISIAGDRYERYPNHVASTKISQPEKVTSPIRKDEYVESTPNSVSETDSLQKVTGSNISEDIVPAVSVKNLKEKFQSVQNNFQEESKLRRSVSTYKKEYTLSSSKKISNNVTTVTIKKDTEESGNAEISKSNETYVAQEYEIVDISPSDVKKQISVTNLRNIFEMKSQEGSAGLSLILNEEKPPITRLNYKKYLNEEPELVILSPVEVKNTHETASRLLAILKNEDQSVRKEFKYELNISKESDVAEENSYDLVNDEFDTMASLEYVEEDENSDNDTISEESVQSIKIVAINNDDNSENDLIIPEQSAVGSDDYKYDTANVNGMHENDLEDNYITPDGSDGVSDDYTREQSLENSFETAKTLTMEYDLNSVEYEEDA